jgi:hypothetical protein
VDLSTASVRQTPDVNVKLGVSRQEKRLLERRKERRSGLSIREMEGILDEGRE